MRNSKITRIIKCDLVRQARMDQPFSRQNAKFIRESTISPVIKSITEFDHNDPLTESRRPQHFRGKSVTNRQFGNNGNILHKLGNLDDALLKAQNLLDNKPKDENYLYLKGRVLEKLERTNEAEKCFKEALDINPKFAQAAFFLAAIENKRGNFEKSIDMYNYALSKDKIPTSGHKKTLPLAPIDIGFAYSNTTKANFTGKVNNLASNPWSINPEDLLKTEEKRKEYATVDFSQIKVIHQTNPSGSLSTNLPTSVKEESKMQKQSSYGSNTAKPKHPKTTKASPKHLTGTYTQESSPCVDQKKLRKAWRMGKSGNLNQNKPITQKYTQEFYSLGNSLNKGDTASLVSSSQVTSQLPSSLETKSSFTDNKNSKKKKIKATKKINFSDRMLSSKLYSIKRQEIFLYERQARNKMANKSLTNSIERNEKGCGSSSNFIPRSSVKPKNKKQFSSS